MTFEYLHLGRYMHLTEFLQHIEDIGHLELQAGCKWSTLVKELREKYKDNPEKLAAVDDWIEVNESGDMTEDIEMLEHKGYLTYNFKSDN